jgi:1,4-alpha-glucan branching enzyme
MSDYAGTIGTGVYINGTFNGWCGDCNPMIDAGGGIWKVTLPLDPGTIQYKFTVDGWTDQEVFAGG